MDIVIILVLLLIGLVLIIKGGDIFVDGASWMAEVSGIPKFIIGATVVSVATTLPELLTSAFAASRGQVDMAIGNAVGSVTANIGLIMAISLMAMAGSIKRKDYIIKFILMIGAAAIIAIFGASGELTLPICIVLLCFFAVNIWENIHAALKNSKESSKEEKECEVEVVEPKKLDLAFYVKAILLGIMFVLSIVLCILYTEQITIFQAVVTCVFAAYEIYNNVNEYKNPEAENAEPKKDVKAIIQNVLKFVIGAACIVVGADLLVDNGSALALFMGVSERVISVTIVAVGTSLPELITTVTAVAKKESDLSVGNIIGANILDLTLILPICSVISGQSLPVTQQMGFVDLPACLLVGLIACAPAFIMSKFKKWQGFALLGTYVAYLVITIFFVPIWIGA